LLPGNVVRFRKEPRIAIPHMGWNQVEYLREHPLFAGIPNGTDFYFVHSFHPEPSDPGVALAQTTLGSQTFACALERGNVVATQFHPEKSGAPGLRLLQNFANWKPSGELWSPPPVRALADGDQPKC
jgi:glutamine amidotransferase